MGVMYCPSCGTVDQPRKHTKGSFVLELLLWLLFIVPGSIYSLWRRTTRALVCPGCGAPDMLPVDAPQARAALAKSLEGPGETKA